DSHLELPVVDAQRADLMETDVQPFRAAIEAGVSSIMTAHVAYPALDPTGTPATTSREILQWLLRQQLHFDGLIVSDSLVMKGALAGRDEGQAAIAALNAGCDVLLYPSDVATLVARLHRALETHELSAENVRNAVRRRLKWAQWASPPNEYRKPAVTDIAWGEQLAERVVRMVRGARPTLASPMDVVVIDDDLGGPAPATSRAPFLDALERAGFRAQRVPEPSNDPARTTVIALFGETQPWKGRAGYSDAARSAVERACALAPTALLVQFGHPRLIRELPSARSIVTAGTAAPAMQVAAARWMRG